MIGMRAEDCPHERREQDLQALSKDASSHFITCRSTVLAETSHILIQTVSQGRQSLFIQIQITERKLENDHVIFAMGAGLILQRLT